MLNKSSVPSRRALAAVTTRRRKRGRPPAAQVDDVKQALLTAARELFTRYGYRAVSSRQIATAAGANAAMIRYYFGGKAGLYREMLESALAPLRSRLEAMDGRAEQGDLLQVIAVAMRTYAANSWAAGLIVREVLATEGPLRGIFVRELAGKLAPAIASLVRREQQRGRIRRDVDPQLATLSLASLAAFPFVALPATSRVFGVSTDEAFVARLVAHTTELLRRGLAAPEAPR
jgi:AcrR family transcriptional regulator